MLKIPPRPTIGHCCPCMAHWRLYHTLISYDPTSLKSKWECPELDWSHTDGMEIVVLKCFPQVSGPSNSLSTSPNGSSAEPLGWRQSGASTHHPAALDASSWDTSASSRCRPGGGLGIKDWKSWMVLLMYCYKDPQQNQLDGGWWGLEGRYSWPRTHLLSFRAYKWTTERRGTQSSYPYYTRADALKSNNHLYTIYYNTVLVKGLILYISNISYRGARNWDFCPRDFSRSRAAAILSSGRCWLASAVRHKLRGMETTNSDWEKSRCASSLGQQHVATTRSAGGYSVVQGHVWGDIIYIYIYVCISCVCS